MLIEKQSAIDDEIMRYLQEHGDQMADYGWVTKGTWIEEWEVLQVHVVQDITYILQLIKLVHHITMVMVKLILGLDI